MQSKNGGYLIWKTQVCSIANKYFSMNFYDKSHIEFKIMVFFCYYLIKLPYNYNNTQTIN